MTPTIIIPPILALPLAGLLMVVVAIHMEHTLDSNAPRSRKRIRLANGWIMLLGIPLLAVGSSLIAHDTHPRLFAIVWSLSILFLTLALMLALGDVLNTMRLAGRNHARLNTQFKTELIQEMIERSRDNASNADNLSQESHDSTPA
ncbi:MAG: hypothetical protein ACYTF7_03465 [Planctomycetota bacterium]|jgi:hypothetical protein